MSQEHKLFMKAMDENAGSWDFGGVHYLENGGFLAYVLDAPVKANQQTGEMAGMFLRAAVSRLAKLLPLRDEYLAALVLSDLVTAAGTHLVEEGRGQAYAAGAFVLAYGGFLHVLTVGDCAAWVSGPTTIRLSEATRAGGGSFLSLFGNDIQKPLAYKEASYLGAALRTFTQRDVTTLPDAGVKHVALMSDGAEQQVGLVQLAGILRAADTPAAIREKFSALLTGSLIDDVTLLAVPVTPTGSQAEQLRGEIQGALAQSAQLAQEIRNEISAHSLALKSEIANQKSEAAQLRHGLESQDKESKTLRSSLEKYCEKLNEISNYAGGLSGQLDSHAQTVRRLEGDIANGRRESVSRKDLQDVASAASTAARDLRIELGQNINTKFTELDRRISQIPASKPAPSPDLRDLERQIESLNRKLSDLEAQFDSAIQPPGEEHPPLPPEDPKTDPEEGSQTPKGRAAKWLSLPDFTFSREAIIVATVSILIAVAIVGTVVALKPWENGSTDRKEPPPATTATPAPTATPEQKTETTPTPAATPERKTEGAKATPSQAENPPAGQDVVQGQIVEGAGEAIAGTTTPADGAEAASSPKVETRHAPNPTASPTPRDAKNKNRQ